MGRIEFIERSHYTPEWSFQLHAMQSHTFEPPTGRVLLMAVTLRVLGANKKQSANVLDYVTIGFSTGETQLVLPGLGFLQKDFLFRLVSPLKLDTKIHAIVESKMPENEEMKLVLWCIHEKKRP